MEMIDIKKICKAAFLLKFQANPFSFSVDLKYLVFLAETFVLPVSYLIE